MRRAWIGGAAVFVAVFALGGASAWAQAAGASAGTGLVSSEEASAKAEVLFKEGREAVAKQNWGVAEAKFDAAFALNPSYDVATNLGNTQYRLGKLREAATHLAFALRVWPLSAKLDQRELVTKRVAELRKTLATLTIRVSVEGAAVLVDGKSVGRSPLSAEVFVEPGARVIEAKLAGYEDAKRPLDVAQGSTQEVALTLVALPSAGGPKGIKPLEPGGGGEVKPPGETKGDGTTVGGPSKPLVIAGIATSATLLSAGVVFAIVSSAKANDAATLREALVTRKNPNVCSVPAPDPACGEIESSLSIAETSGDLAVWSFVAGGILGAATAIYALAAPKPKSPSPVRVAPILASKGGGLLITGAW